MRRNEIITHSKFAEYASFIERIPSEFMKMGVVIHKDRNEVRIVEENHLTLVIKSYDRITIANRFIYTFLRKPKATRAYENALALQSKGISTPAPVAYINLHNGMMLQKSYFISIYEDATSLSELVEKPLSESREVIKAFARFVYHLHTQGIFHHDLHLENIICKFHSSTYEFYLIDINRLKFQKPTRRRKSKNLVRIYMSLEKYSIFIQEYARIGNSNPYRVLLKTTFYKQSKSWFKSFKKGIKTFLRPILPSYN